MFAPPNPHPKKIQEEIEESNKQTTQSTKATETKATETTSNAEPETKPNAEPETKTEPAQLQKPTDKVKRRELFAKMAEQRQKNRYKKSKR